MHFVQKAISDFHYCASIARFQEELSLEEEMAVPDFDGAKLVWPFCTELGLDAMHRHWKKRLKY